MLQANEAGLGPLAWVRGEIEAAVKQARVALADTAGSDDQEGIRFALTHLHQVRGALAIIGLDGQMDIALAIRTIVVPTDMREAGQWLYHVQAAGGIVADSQPRAEYLETVNKAAALARAIDVAEQAFL